MALFGGDMVQVTTPDGRTITVPSQLAAQFPGLTPASVPPPGGPVELPSGGAPTWTPQDGTGLAAMTPPPEPVASPASAGPVTSPGQAPASGVRAPQGAVTDPAQLPAGGPDNTPALTNAQLAKMGNSGAYQAESDALDAKAAAAKRLGQIDADEATHAGQMMAIRDAESQRQLEANAKLANDLQSQLQAKQNEYTQNAKAITDTKTDRTADHPILAAIGIALAGIGTAMKKESVNPALAAFYAAIDRKVAGQMQDLDKRRAGLSDQKDALGMQRQSNMDRLARADQLRLGYLDQAQNQINTLKTMSQSDRSKANADMMTANIQEEKAKTLDSAMQREHAAIIAEQARKDALKMHQESLGVQYAGQAQSERHFNKTLAEQVREHDLQRQDKLDQLQLDYAKLGQKDKAAKAGEVKKLGIWDPTTGDPLLDPEGQTKLKQADRLEATARQVKDPALAAQQSAQAKAIRDEAMVTNAVVAPSEKTAEEIRPALSSAQNLIDTTRKIRAFLESDPSVTDRAGWAALQTEYGVAQGNYAKSIGEKVSQRALDGISHHIMSFDPGSSWARVADKGKALASIKALEGVVKGDVDTKLRSSGIKSGWTPRSADEGAISLNLGDKTSQEIGKDEEPGVGTRVLGRIMKPITGIDSEAPQIAAENATHTGPTGLSPAATASVQALAKRADLVGNTERAQIVQALAAPLLSDRESLANGVAGLLRGENPKLYREIMDQLPPLRAKELSQFDDVRSQLPGANLPPLRGPGN